MSAETSFILASKSARSYTAIRHITISIGLIKKACCLISRSADKEILKFSS